MTTIRSLADAPRLLGPAPFRTETLAECLCGGGYAAMPPDALLHRFEASGLRDRGGAAFPLAVKLRAVRDQPGVAAVVANGEEGEPGSVKDRQLMRTRPHLMHVSDPESAEAIRQALASRPAPVEVVEVSPAYVAGEETAVVRFIDGGPALPVAKPPRPYQVGVGGAPTLISNVETLAHLALLASGVDSTRNLLITVSGTGIEPSLIEVDQGATLRSILTACGWWHVTGALVGGLFGGLVNVSALDLPLDVEALKASGTALGCGAIRLFAPADCPVRLAVAALNYLALESARQCGVCISGSTALADAVTRLQSGAAISDDVARISRWAAGLPERGACGLLAAAARVAGTLLANFPSAVAAHLCDECIACEVPSLPAQLRVEPPSPRMSSHLRRNRSTMWKLRVDPTSCQAYGLCHQQAPDVIELDEWGYASVMTPDVPAGQEGAARAAVAICPNLALRLEGK